MDKNQHNNRNVPQEDTNCPFMFILLMGPSSVTVTHLLTQTNYHARAHATRKALGGKKSRLRGWCHPCPWPCNIIHSWFMNSAFIFLDNVFYVSIELKERFSQGD